MELRGGDRVAAGRAHPRASYVQQLTGPAVHRLSLSALISSARPGGAVDATGLPRGRPPGFIAFYGADRDLGRRTRMDLDSLPQPADRQGRVRDRTGSRAARAFPACGALLGH